MNNTFADLGYTAGELSAFICNGNAFVLAQKNRIVRYVAADAAAFKEWLNCHGIADRTEETGTLVMEHYFPGYCSECLSKDEGYSRYKRDAGGSSL